MGKQLKKIKKIQNYISEINASVKKIQAIAEKEKNKDLKLALSTYILYCGSFTMALLVRLQQLLPEQTQLDLEETEFKKLMEGFD